MQCVCVNRSAAAITTTAVSYAKLSPWGPQTCHGNPSAVKSAFLFDKWSRCDPISVLQMPRFPVMLFPFCLFFTLLFLSAQLSLSRFTLSFSSFTPLFQGLPGQGNAPLAALSQHIHHSAPLTEACRPPAAKPTGSTADNSLLFFLPLGNPHTPTPIFLPPQ